MNGGHLEAAWNRRLLEAQWMECQRQARRPPRRLTWWQRQREQLAWWLASRLPHFHQDYLAALHLLVMALLVALLVETWLLLLALSRLR